jgi:hypothetical protein
VYNGNSVQWWLLPSSITVDYLHHRNWQVLPVKRLAYCFVGCLNLKQQRWYQCRLYSKVCWRRVPVIIVTWEAQIGRIMVRSQPGQKVCKTPCLPIAGYYGAYLLSQAMGEAEIRSSSRQARQKITRAKGAGGVAQVLECLQNKHTKSWIKTLIPQKRIK